MTGALAGGGPNVRVLRPNGFELNRFYAFDPNFSGGVNVALGDVDGYGYQDIIAAAGPGAAPHVKVYSGLTYEVIRSFYAYGENFAGGVNVASCDVNGDHFADIITGAGGGFANAAPHVRVFSGANPAVSLGSFYAYEPAFHGGVRVAAADMDGDGKAELITAPGPGGGPRVRFVEADGTAVANTPVNGFYAYDPNFNGGVYLAANVDANHQSKIVTGAGPGGSQHVKVINPDGTISSQFITPEAGNPGATVSIGQLDADAPDEIIVGRATGSAFVRGYDQPDTQFGTGSPYPGFPGGVSTASGVI